MSFVWFQIWIAFVGKHLRRGSARNVTVSCSHHNRMACLPKSTIATSSPGGPGQSGVCISSCVFQARGTCRPSPALLLRREGERPLSQRMRYSITTVAGRKTKAPHRSRISAVERSGADSTISCREGRRPGGTTTRNPFPAASITSFRLSFQAVCPQSRGCSFEGVARCRTVRSETTVSPNSAESRRGRTSSTTSCNVCGISRAMLVVLQTRFVFSRAWVSGSHLLDMDMMALPPGRSTLWISLNTSRGLFR